MELSTNILMQEVQTIEEIFQIFENSQNENFQPFIFNISEPFEAFQGIELNKFDLITSKPFLLAIQSKIDAGFKIIWKLNEIFTLNIFDDIDVNDLSELCLFIFKFLSNCIENNHSGITNDEKINLSSLTDSNGLNLFFAAAQSGNTKIVKILLHIAFNVDFKSPGNDMIAADYAYENYHFETLLELLKANSKFPKNFDINQSSENVKEFAKLSQEIHKSIELGNLNEVQEILNENSNLSYFYDFFNVSAVAAAIKHKQFSIYELLSTKKRFFAPHEDEVEMFDFLNKKEKEKIKEIHSRLKKELQPKHINVLISKSFVGHDVDEINSKIEKVAKCYRILNQFKPIEILLKIASLINSVHIVFDFRRDSINYLDPTRDRNVLGLFYDTGTIYIGARQILDGETVNITLATIAHEICHFVLFIVFENFAKPYKIDDHKSEEEFENISEECENKKELEDIIGIVYDIYEEEFQHAELIVRVPHILAHYFAYPEDINFLKENFKSLFDFYELKLMPKLEQALIEIETKDEREIKREIRRRDRKISILKIIFLFLVIVVGTILYIVYDPNYNFNELSDEKKEKVLNGIVKFEEIEMKFNELFNQNHSNVFNILNSQHIKVLINEKVLNLSESQNQFLETEIYLIYSNMTKELRVKIENSLIDFQGALINFKSIADNETKIYKTLNCKEIFDIIKHKKVLLVGQKIRNETKFYVERKFSLKVKNSTELFLLAQKEKKILLSDNAGNGKTTVFKHLALEYKTKFPLFWIQYVNMRNFIEIYKNFKFDIYEALYEISNVKTLLEKFVLKKCLENSKFIIFWDGFDEISPSYTNESLKLIKAIKHETKAIQFIATRPHYAENITTDLKTKTIIEMKPYEKEEKKEFLMKFFAFKNLTENEIEKATNHSFRLISKIQSDDRSFVGSPMLLFMIAEVSLSNVNSINEPKSYYETYEYFTKMKLEMTNDKGNVVREIILNILTTNRINFNEYHQFYALKYLFPDIKVNFKNLEILNKYEKNSKVNATTFAHFGLIIVNLDGNVEFIHRTFAEFFVVQYFVDNFYEIEIGASQKEINTRLDLIIEKLYNSDFDELKKFAKSYLESSKFTFSGKTEKYFGKNMAKRIKSDFFEIFDQIKLYDEYFQFSKDFRKQFWIFNENLSYFNVFAIKNPEDYHSKFNSFMKQVKEDFSHNRTEQKIILYGENLQGSFLLAAFREYKLFLEEFNFKRFLKVTKVNNRSILKEIQNTSTFSNFYYFLKPKLTINEKRRIFMDGFFEFYNNETQIDGIFDELKELFTKDEIENYFCTQIKNLNFNLDENNLEPEHLDKIDFMFDQCKSIEKSVDFLYSQQGSRYCSRIIFYSLSSFVHFYAIWNYVGKNFKEKQIDLLIENVSGYKGGCSTFNLFSQVLIDTEDPQNFETVLKIYEENFEIEKLKEFYSTAMYDLSRTISIPKKETAKIFVDLINKTFTFVEIKENFQEFLIEIYKKPRRKKDLKIFNEDFPLVVLLKHIIGEKMFNEL